MLIQREEILMTNSLVGPPRPPLFVVAAAFHRLLPVGDVGAVVVNYFGVLVCYPNCRLLCGHSRG